MSNSQIRFPLSVNQMPFIKKQIPDIKLFYGHNNLQPNSKYITRLVQFKSYIQDETCPCTYYRQNPIFTASKKFIMPEKSIILLDNGCNISFINCGNGDACLIENQGKYALIDFGGKKNSVATFLSQHLKGNTIDYAVCTHFHSDHMTDFYDVLSNYKVKHLFVVKDIGPRITTSTKKELINFDYNCNADTVTMIEIGHCLDHHSHNFKLGNAEFEFLGPIKDYDNLNDNSIVLKMNYQNVTTLFTGDISSNAEKGLVYWCKLNNIDIKSKIIKVAHHGSRNSSSPLFLNTVGASTAVISCGKVNKYTHPDIEVVDRLSESCDTFITHSADESVDFHITQQGELQYGKSKIYIPFSEDDIDKR